MNIFKNRKEDMIFVGVIVALIIIFIVIRVVKSKKVEAPIVEETPTTLASDEQLTTAPVIVKKKKAATIWPELSYSEEFAKYREGHLIQFNNECQVFPYSMVLKNGSSIMLDNRSKVQQTIKIGDAKHILAPYDFEILTLKAPAIPTTYLIDCNERQNVATLLMQ